MGFSKNRDLPLLVFLWRWKMASTATLALKFFPKQKPHSAYLRLLALKKAGFIKYEPFSKAEGTLWVLTPKGFELIRDSNLPELKEDGYRSEHLEHDFLVTAVHLGEWLIEAPKGVELFSEQQLRRYHEDIFLSWVPKSEERRPDGYWLVPYKNGKLLIALEVELSRKNNETYRNIVGFYSSEETIGRVLWVVANSSQAKTIYEKLIHSGYERSNIHDFVTAKDFRSHGWGAPILYGPDSNKTIFDLLCENPTRNPRKTHENSRVEALLNIKKSGFYQKPTRPLPAA